MQLIVTDEKQFFSAERTDAQSQLKYLALGVPAFEVVNTCQQGRYRIHKQVLTDPRRSVVLQRICFEATQGSARDYGLYVVLTPHIGNQGAGNTAWIGEYKDIPMLFARRGGVALALACSRGWLRRSAGYVGASCGWQDLSQHKRMTWQYQHADDGNVSLTGELDIQNHDGAFVLVLAFGRDHWEAGHRARASLLQGFAAARDKYLDQWKKWQKGVLPLQGSKRHSQNLYHISAAVMRTHESKQFPGAIVASLAMPWGFAQGDDDFGYHLVWPRDMMQTVVGLLAINKLEDARRVLFYFVVTLEADGHWPQNMFLNGRPSWNGVQLDETAFVILLVGLARRERALSREALDRLWPMVQAAAGFIVRNGPISPMDRWEEQAGYFASTMAVEIPALLVAADLAETLGENEQAAYLRETADTWNDLVDELIYVRGTELARSADVDGYYVRFARPDQLEADRPAAGYVDLRNHEPGQAHLLAQEIVSPDALCLVRFGLRHAEDPRITNTVQVIDRTLRVETPNGPCWHRYSHDGYGEHEDGSPFNGTGIGRAWPLLTGERAHYELAAGRTSEAEKLQVAMESFANESGLLPEQIWDADDIPERRLYFGQPTGSAMPLVWAHAEYVKLRRSLHDGQVFDTPRQAVERYIEKDTYSRFAVWRFEQKRRAMAESKTLRIEVRSPAVVHWSMNGWAAPQDAATRDTGLGLHVADLATHKAEAGCSIVFTFYWPDSQRWEGKDFDVVVEKQRARPEMSRTNARNQATRGESHQNEPILA
jgi:glucoamylase